VAPASNTAKHPYTIGFVLVMHWFYLRKLCNLPIAYTNNTNPKRKICQANEQDMTKL